MSAPLAAPLVAPLFRRSAWIREFRHSPAPRARLVCMPHAGGSASFFRSWREPLPPDLDLLAVQYPGREDRFGEACATDLGALADATAHALRDYADRPLFLFGHSLGASLAYEVALRLESDGRPLRRVFVSAHPPPHRQRVSDLYRQDDDALIDDVRRLAGGSAGLLEEPEARAMFLPMLRADYRIIETYRRAEPPPLRAPIEVLLPLHDSEFSRDEAQDWQALSGAPVVVHEFDGGHFYLQQQAAALVRRLLPSLTTR